MGVVELYNPFKTKRIAMSKGTGRRKRDTSSLPSLVAASASNARRVFLAASVFNLKVKFRLGQTIISCFGPEKAKESWTVKLADQAVCTVALSTVWALGAEWLQNVIPVAERVKRKCWKARWFRSEWGRIRGGDQRGLTLRENHRSASKFSSCNHTHIRPGHHNQPWRQRENDTATQPGQNGLIHVKTTTNVETDTIPVTSTGAPARSIWLIGAYPSSHTSYDRWTSTS